MITKEKKNNCMNGVLKKNDFQGFDDEGWRGDEVIWFVMGYGMGNVKGGLKGCPGGMVGRREMAFGAVGGRFGEKLVDYMCCGKLDGYWEDFFK